MWDKLAAQIDVELQELRHRLNVHRPLTERCGTTAPQPIELSALAAMLHSFYTGVEHILKRVAVEIDRTPPAGESWHRGLLDAMATPAAGRPAVITRQTHEGLLTYLAFRHVFRHAYSFHLRWEKMSDLVLDCEETFGTLQGELTTFLKAARSANP